MKFPRRDKGSYWRVAFIYMSSYYSTYIHEVTFFRLIPKLCCYPDNGFRLANLTDEMFTWLFCFPFISMTTIPTSTVLHSFRAWSCILCWSADQLQTGIQDVADTALAANSAAMAFHVQMFLYWKTYGSYSTCRMRQKNQLIFLDHSISDFLVILSSFVKKIFKESVKYTAYHRKRRSPKAWCEVHTTLLSTIQLHLGAKIEQWKGLYLKTYTYIQRMGNNEWAVWERLPWTIEISVWNAYSSWTKWRSDTCNQRWGLLPHDTYVRRLRCWIQFLYQSWNDELIENFVVSAKWHNSAHKESIKNYSSLSVPKSSHFPELKTFQSPSVV